MHDLWQTLQSFASRFRVPSPPPEALIADGRAAQQKKKSFRRITNRTRVDMFDRLIADGRAAQQKKKSFRKRGSLMAMMPESDEIPGS